MTETDLINQVKETAGEWLEMSPDPSATMLGIMTHKVIQLQSYIEYLEKRLQYATNP